MLKTSFKTAILVGFLGLGCNSGTNPVATLEQVSTERPEPQKRTYSTDVLVFNGAGTASADSNALIEIAKAQGLSHDVVSSSELGAMTAEELSRYGLILWPGGN